MKECRFEFVELAGKEGVNFRQLCERFGVSRKTGYKWAGRQDLENRSRRPNTSPNRTAPEIEALVLELAGKKPSWGARKLRSRLIHQGFHGIPAVSTVVQILRRNGIERLTQAPAGPWQRFEHSEPNELWQMDFKGHFAIDGARCHPLTVLDDCSRYSLCVEACHNQKTQTVKERLTRVFERYGLPWAILCDNGSPWGSETEHRLNPLSVWLMKLGVEVWHGRPYHPQTQGKLERFHRTLKLEALQGNVLRTLLDCQQTFDQFRHQYNHERPHQALDMQTPANRYHPSARSFPNKLSEPEYGHEWSVRKVTHPGLISYKGQELDVPQALIGEHVGIQHLSDHLIEVRYFARIVSNIDLRDYANV